MSTATQSQSERGRSARGAFRRYSLGTVEELVTAIQEVGHGEKARTISVLNKIDRQPTATTTKSLLTAAVRGYGLVAGSASSTHLSLTERGNALVSADSDLERRSVAYDALQQSDAFQTYVDKFKHRPMPSDEVAVDHLKDTFGFSENDTVAAVKVIKQNLAEYGLLDAVGERQVINPPDEVLEAMRSSLGADTSEDSKLVVGDVEPAIAANALQLLPIQTPGATPKVIVPQIAFNIQLQLPGDASPEAFEAIFKAMAKHLLGRTPE